MRSLADLLPPQLNKHSSDGIITCCSTLSTSFTRHTLEGVSVTLSLTCGLQESGQGEQFQALLNDIEEASLEGGALNKACNKLQGLVSGLQPPAQLCKDIGKRR